MILKKYLLALLAGIFTLSASVRAQNIQAQNLPLIVQPGPVAQEFQKYQDYPVSYATGIPEVTIPFYTIEAAGITIPVGLSYHASGIKVAQTPYPVGLGWSLQPDFRISRTIMGNPDEYLLKPSSGGIENADEIWYMEDRPEASTRREMYYFVDLIFGDRENKSKDTQHDIFHISIPGYSGSFILQRKSDGTLETVNIPDSPLKIEIEPYVTFIRAFTVTDDQGVVYHFGSNGNDLTFEESSSGHNTSWMLREIVLPDEPSSKISFTYVHEQINDIQYNVLRTDFYYEGDGWTCFCSENGHSHGPYVGKCEGAIDPVTNNIPAVCLLKCIRFPHGSLSVDYSNRFIRKVSVHDDSGWLVKEMSFTQKDNLLSSLNVRGEGRYTFTYNAERIENIYDMDHWGYYNKKGNTEESLAPRMVRNGVNIGYADRSADEQAMKACLLEKIAYPMGGHTTFDFEANRTDGGVLCGGLRIKRMAHYDNQTGGTIVKEYRYGENESGYANVVFGIDSSLYTKSDWMYLDNVQDCPKPGSPDDHSVLYSYINPLVERITVLSHHYLSPYMSTHFMVWYSSVTEYISDGGKNVYRYWYDGGDFKQNGLGYLYLSHNRSLVEKMPHLGMLEQYKLEDGEYRLVRKTHNTVQELNSRDVVGLVAEELVRWEGNNYAWRAFNDIQFGQQVNKMGNIFPFSYTNYKIRCGIRQVESTTVEDYTGNGTVFKTIRYTYDRERPYNLVEKTETSSKGGTIGERYYYSNSTHNELSPNQQYLLEQNNRLTTILGKDYTADEGSGQAVEYSEKFEFQQYGGKLVLPYKVWTKTKGESVWDDRVTYHSYDQHGNPTQISKTGDTPVSYLWGYDYQYPIAKIVGASYGEVQSAVGDTQVQGLRNIAELGPLYASLRSQLQHAQVTGYTYRPLVGMTSETGPDGLSTFYRYDTFGRLRRILDHNSNVVKQYRYHYAGQNDLSDEEIGELPTDQQPTDPEPTKTTIYITATCVPVGATCEVVVSASQPVASSITLSLFGDGGLGHFQMTISANESRVSQVFNVPGSVVEVEAISKTEDDTCYYQL